MNETVHGVNNGTFKTGYRIVEEAKVAWQLQ